MCGGLPARMIDDMNTTRYETPASQAKLLRRSADDKWIAGVCSGVARYAGIDVVLVRLLLVVLTVLSFGTGVLAYLVAWLVIPRKPDAVRPSTAVGTPGVEQLGETSDAQPNSTPWARGSSVE